MCVCIYIYTYIYLYLFLPIYTHTERVRMGVRIFLPEHRRGWPSPYLLGWRPRPWRRTRSATGRKHPKTQTIIWGMPSATDTLETSFTHISRHALNFYFLCVFDMEGVSFLRSRSGVRHTSPTTSRRPTRRSLDYER